jgi:serine/threonine-protein kinase
MYPQVFGKYILERELGRGGMARILLATLRGAGGFEKKLVVKQIRDELLVDGEFVRRFVEEAKTTVALSHPNIVPVYELGVEQGTYFLAMELVEGLSLDQLLRHEAHGGERNKLFPEEGAYIGVEVCRALSYAHRRMKVVHRDITPRNVMIDEEGQVKLIDFGIAAPARVVGQEVFGSPGHMPPEQVQGQELGPATDIFAVAVLLMEAWSGHAPFRRKTMEECDAAMLAPHPKPSDTDPRLIPLDETILRAMSLQPRARQQDADELGRSLRHFLTGIDLADVARTLGARVYHARKNMASGKQEETGRPSSARAPSQAEVYTQTFAARDEVDKWSERPISGPQGDESGGPMAPSTRRIANSTPPFPVTRAIKDEQGPQSDPPRSDGAPRSDAGPSRTDSGARSGSTTASVVETIATRPIETPVRPLNSMLPKARAAAGRKGMLQGAIGVAVAAVALWFFVVRPSAGPTGVQDTRDAGLSVAVSVTGAPSPGPSVAVTAPSTAPSTSAAPSSASTVVRPPSSNAGSGTSASTATNSAQPPASLALFGTPGTRVSIDGQPSRPCPARFPNVSAGAHDIRFLFDQTGESRGERLTLKPGEHVTLRADFTQAVPTVQIIR